MKTLLDVMATTLQDGALAASPRHARESAMLDCGGRGSQRQSVVQLSVDGKSPSDRPARQTADVLPAVVADSPS